MAIGRTYTVDSGQAQGIVIGTGAQSGTEWVIMYGGAPAGVEFNISAIRVATATFGAGSYPSNGTITWRLRRVTGANTGVLAGTAVVNSIGPSTSTASSVWIYSTANGSGTATFPTSGNVLWSQTLPCTAGANWGEWFTPGFEINVGPQQAQSTIAITYEIGGGTTANVNLMPELVISE